MPYDTPDYKTVLWENGKPYWMTASGQKTFIPPLVAAQMRDDPHAQAWARQMGVNIDYQTGEDGNVTVGEGGVQNNSAPGSSLFKTRGTWDSDKGEWDQDVNWSNIMSMGVGGAMAAPFVAGALAGGAGGSAAAGGGAAASGAGAGLGTAGTVAGTGAATGAAAGGGGLTASMMGTYLPLAQMGVGTVAGALKGRQDQKNVDAQLELQRMAIEQSNAMQGANFARSNPSVQMGNSARGDILANAQKAGSTGTGRDLKLTGGMGPQNFSDNTRQLGSQISREALLAALGQGGPKSPYKVPFGDEDEQATLRTRQGPR